VTQPAARRETATGADRTRDTRVTIMSMRATDAYRPAVWPASDRPSPESFGRYKQQARHLRAMAVAQTTGRIGRFIAALLTSKTG
jgi:hypothetical protein